MELYLGLGKLGSSPSFTMELALVTWASVSPSEEVLKRFFSEQNVQVYVMTIQARQAHLWDRTNFTTRQESFGARSLG